ncbi:MAG TPA: OmpA family protein, partial [Prolixibacteraceae bacterium]|nr:OmpA family protein [Prolixibacteraceae bacterium]
NIQGQIQNILVEPAFPGKVSIKLPIGTDFVVGVTMKDYETNQLVLSLSHIVLYDRFIRDIELQPTKRTLRFFVFDKESGAPLEAYILLINKKRGYKIIPVKSNGQAGYSSATLREGEAFQMEIRGPRGYAFQSLSFDLDEQRDLDQLDVALSPLKIKVPIRLNNINFEFNSSDLLETSYEELDRVYQLLIDNPEIRTEIMAHTDDVGSDEYNIRLAQKRAQSVASYLFSKGIAPLRILSKGYGESMPLVPNNSDENRALNRRVELKILDTRMQEIHEIEKEIQNE